MDSLNKMKISHFYSVMSNAVFRIDAKRPDGVRFLRHVKAQFSHQLH